MIDIINFKQSENKQDVRYSSISLYIIGSDITTSV